MGRASRPWPVSQDGFPALAVALIGLLLVSFAVAAQETPAAGDETPAAGGPQTEGAMSGGQTDFEASDTDLETIEDLLEQDESVLADPETYTYDPGTRRDPFRSLLEVRESADDEPRERPKGKGGLLIDEIVVEGVFELLDGPVAQVQSAREETSYLLRPGDQLWDGDVISITLNEVVFKQVVEDPTALKPFREVVKRLNP